MEETRFDSNRRLCPDGACIGIIRPDGRCSQCGRAAQSGAPRADGDSTNGSPAGEAASLASVGDDNDGDRGGDNDVLDAFSGPGESGARSGFDPDRRLCPDGSCVGVIGADGRCGICGQTAPPSGT
jgi:hypothetical protein